MRRDLEIDRLDRSIKELRVEYERFFNGALAVPPGELRDRIQAELRRLRERPGVGTAGHFRLTQLEARLNTYMELFNRRLRDREEGGRVPAAGADTSSIDPFDGVTVADKPSVQEVEALYAGLCKGQSKAPQFDLDSFASFLDHQAATIRKKTGCGQVRFRLVEEAGQTKLKAKPISAGS